MRLAITARQCGRLAIYRKGVKVAEAYSRERPNFRCAAAGKRVHEVSDGGFARDLLQHETFHVKREPNQLFVVFLTRVSRCSPSLCPCNISIRRQPCNLSLSDIRQWWSIEMVVALLEPAGRHHLRRKMQGIGLLVRLGSTGQFGPSFNVDISFVKGSCRTKIFPRTLELHMKKSDCRHRVHAGGYHSADFDASKISNMPSCRSCQRAVIGPSTVYGP